MLIAPEIVIANAVFVLSSKRLYALEREHVAELLSPLVRLPGFHVRNRGAVLRAFAIFATNRVDCGDVMIVANVERTGIGEMVSYNRDSDRFPDINRSEP
ncbi:MAG: hypothetical protein M3R06_04565 [Chloroflexota bacterium]|nr:hypothetical protein [Chloroflexota bacterium]